MTTTFAVKIKDGKYIEIAVRRGIGMGKVEIHWLNPLAKMLHDDIPVYVIDNTPQGIYTIGDLKAEKEK